MKSVYPFNDVLAGIWWIWLFSITNKLLLSTNSTPFKHGIQHTMSTAKSHNPISGHVLYCSYHTAKIELSLLYTMMQKKDTAFLLLTIIIHNQMLLQPHHNHPNHFFTQEYFQTTPFPSSCVTIPLQSLIQATSQTQLPRNKIYRTDS